MAIDRTELAQWLREHDYALITREQAERIGRARSTGMVPWAEHRQALAKADAEIAKLRSRVVQLEDAARGVTEAVDYAGPLWTERLSRAVARTRDALAAAERPTNGSSHA